jgi:branched-chain amino acid transport system permease protein
VAFVVALAGMIAVYLFLKRSYLGTAIRAISQDRAIMPLMGVNPDRIFLVTSALGGGLAGLGNMVGAFLAAFIFAQFISVGGYFLHIEWGYVLAFVFFIAVMFWRPQGILGVK